jgi:hypothetical protein
MAGLATTGIAMRRESSIPRQYFVVRSTEYPHPKVEIWAWLDDTILHRGDSESHHRIDTEYGVTDNIVYLTKASGSSIEKAMAG